MCGCVSWLLLRWAASDWACCYYYLVQPSSAWACNLVSRVALAGVAASALLAYY